MSKETQNTELSTDKALYIADVGVSLPKQMIIDEVDKRIDRLYKHSEKVKGAEKKSYEDTCTSFVLFKMWLQEQ